MVCLDEEEDGIGHVLLKFAPTRAVPCQACIQRQRGGIYRTSFDLFDFQCTLMPLHVNLARAGYQYPILSDFDVIFS